MFASFVGILYVEIKGIPKTNSTYACNCSFFVCSSACVFTTSFRGCWHSILKSEEDKTSAVSLEYWFQCIDLDCDGQIRPSEMRYFYAEQLHRMECLSQVMIVICGRLYPYRLQTGRHF